MVPHYCLAKVYLQAGIRSTRLSTLDLSRDTITSFTIPHYTHLRHNTKTTASPAVQQPAKDPSEARKPATESRNGA